MKTRYSFVYLMVFLLASLNIYGQPIITSISPSTGPSSGGASVTIEGSGFTGTTTIDFGTVPAVSFIIMSDTSIAVTTPEHTPQVTTVSVTTPSGTSISSENSYYTFQGTWQAYVTNSGGDFGGGTTVSVFDTANIAGGSIPVTVVSEPNALFLTPDGSQVYVANYGNGLGNTVSVIDTASNTVIGSPLTVGSGPNSVSITPDGKQVYVANSSTNTVSVIDIVTQVINTITVGNGPTAIAITPNGIKAYVANFNDNTASDINTATNTVIGGPIPAGNGPLTISITPDSTQAYVGNFNGTSISVIDTATDSVTTVPQALGPGAVAITPDGTKAYVVNYGFHVTVENVVYVIDTATNTVITTIEVGVGPTLVAITPNGETVYVVNYNNGDPNFGTVSIIDTATDTVIGSPLTVGIGPNAIAITPDGAQVYIANFGGDVISGTTVSVIDTATNAVSSITVGNAPTAIAITPDQAPLAKFIVNVAQAGQPSIFDASASVTPTGTISLYSWDFGDGHTLSTSNPITFHIYNTAGNYTATLTVTNSAGTSTTQIFSYYAYNNNNFGSYNMPMTNNGGATAITNKTLSINPASPIDFHGCQLRVEFLNVTEYVNILTWKAPLTGGSGIVSYKIYRDAGLTQLIATIPATSQLKFEDANRAKNVKYTYYIVSVSATGVSPEVSTTVHPKAKCCF